MVTDNPDDRIPLFDAEITDEAHALLPLPEESDMALAGLAANAAARDSIFSDYHSRRSINTLRRQHADLALFAEYLAAAGVQADARLLQHTARAWEGMTWGLVEGFKRWMLQQGYALGSVNVRLSTVKSYAELAAKAEAISITEYALIRRVGGYNRREQRRVDQKRELTRRGVKKARPVRLTPRNAAALLDQPPTPQGRRDRLMLTLLLEHGLRCGEVAGLAVEDVDLERGVLRFFRPKVNKVQTHRLTTNTQRAAAAYFENGDAPSSGPLLRASLKNGHLGKAGMSERAITRRVRLLGEAIGIQGLSAHDCRHYWATHAAQSGTDAFTLQEAGGWSSLAMPRRYVEEAEIANQGLRGFE
ncbi:MAG: hypothetical protein Kow00124_03370 [Anaerolineae bacterium]